MIYPSKRKLLFSLDMTCHYDCTQKKIFTTRLEHIFLASYHVGLFSEILLPNLKRQKERYQLSPIGKFRPSKLPYWASLFSVKHKSRFGGINDHCALHAMIKTNNTPITQTDKMFDRIGKAKFHSMLTRQSRFHEIRIPENDIEKNAFKIKNGHFKLLSMPMELAFNTKNGHFKLLSMPMGFGNVPAIFRALANSVFYDVTHNVLVFYVDDIFIYSDTREEHLMHLRTEIRWLKGTKLFERANQFDWMNRETEFLCLQVGKEGITTGVE